MYWVDIQLAQRKGLKFYQTRCNAIILYDTLTAYCISKVIESVCVTSTTTDDFLQRQLDVQFGFRIARSSKDIQRIELKPNTQLSSKGTKFDRDTLNLEKHDKVTDPTSTGKLVSGHQSTKRCVLTPRQVVNNQTGTGKPVTVDQEEEHQIDFRVPGLSHSVVKEAEHLRIQELVKKIESHPHREALQADLQQNNVCNPFSKKSKEVIRERGNVEIYKLCETPPKVQCSHCLLYWNQGIVYCTCGQFLVDSESRRRFNKLRLDVLSIPNYVIKKGLTHGARHIKTEEQKEFQKAWNAWKRRCKKVDSQGGHFSGIHDRFLWDPVYRESQLAIGWTEQKCKEWDELAKEDHTYNLTPEEKRRYKGQWHLTLNKTGKNEAMKLRSDYRAAVVMKNRLHHESGEPIEEPIQPGQQRRTRRGRNFLRRLPVQRSSWSTYRMATLAFISSLSSSWWQEFAWSWKWAHKFFCSNLSFSVTDGFVYSW